MKLTSKMLDHIKTHSNYPASKTELVKECNNLSDFTAEEKKWFSTTLPNRTYNNANDVIRVLGG